MRSSLLAVTHFDEDEDAESVGILPFQRRARAVMTTSLLHELTHMRLGPRVGCNNGGRTWTEETVRLALLGAPLL